MAISVTESLATFGNANHLNGFIAEYEHLIGANNEVDKPLTQAVHYFAWINTTSEQVFYRIREMIYVNTESHEVFDHSYKALLDHLFKEHSLTGDQIESILLFAKMRHLLVHKGFPNPHTSPSKNSREIASGHAFTSAEVDSLAKKLQSPKCYPELLEKHRVAMKAIDSCEKEFTHDFGVFSISKKRSPDENGPA